MGSSKLKGLIISDFNADNFAALLSNDAQQPAVEMTTAPFGQVYQMLVDAAASFWQAEPDFAVVWSRPQGVIQSFASVLDFQPYELDDLLAEVDQYAELLIDAGQRVKTLFVPTWVLPGHWRGFGLLDMRRGLGITNALMQMNLRLAERLDGQEHIYLLNAQPWLQSAGKHAYVPKMWYMGKIAFGNEVFKAAVEDVKAALQAIGGGMKKLIVLDLDDTLWGGIVGDDGWENLALGGHSPTGEAFADFQRALKSLTQRGIVLSIVSKNDEAVALEAIEKHPEMVLRQDDFAGWRINWQDKAQNLVELVSDLNLGLQSVVFIDDNPVERARVRDMLPEVLVPEWPEDKSLYARTLREMRCFDSTVISQEDSRRTQMYVTERQRKSLRSQVGSLDEWLKNLDVRAEVERLNETNLPRAAQLFNKTNQMNLSTRRMPAEELMAWAQASGHILWTVRVADKFGDSGLTGIFSLELDGPTARIRDFLLSCRVMGRKIEQTMAAVAVQHAREQGVEVVEVTYQPTAKNRPCLEFWQQSGFACDPDGQTFRWNCEQPYPLPESVTLVEG